MSEPIVFLQAFERLITQKLQTFCVKENNKLNRDKLDDIYHVIEEATIDIFARCKFDLVEKSKTFVAERMFAGLTINGMEDMFAGHKYSKHTNVQDLPDADLRLLQQLFAIATMEEEITAEMKRRDL